MADANSDPIASQASRKARTPSSAVPMTEICVASIIRRMSGSEKSATKDGSMITPPPHRSRQPDQETQLDRKPDLRLVIVIGMRGCPMPDRMRCGDIAISEHPLPRHMHILEPHNRVVFVEMIGQRVIAPVASTRLVRFPRHQADAFRRQRHGKRRGKALFARGQRCDGADDQLIGHDRTGAEHLGPAHCDTAVVLLDHGNDQIAFLRKFRLRDRHHRRRHCRECIASVCLQFGISDEVDGPAHILLRAPPVALLLQTGFTVTKSCFCPLSRSQENPILLSRQTMAGVRTSGPTHPKATRREARGNAHSKQGCRPCGRARMSLLSPFTSKVFEYKPR